MPTAYKKVSYIRWCHISLVENVEFRALLKALDPRYLVPSRTLIVSRAGLLLNAFVGLSLRQRVQQGKISLAYLLKLCLQSLE